MIPQCAKELVDVIMLEDFMQRRRALDMWTKRWVSTVILEQPVQRALWQTYAAGDEQAAENTAKAALLDRLLDGMHRDKGVEALAWEKRDDGECVVHRVTLRVLLAKPLERT